MRIVSIVGARPQFIKLGAICRAAEEFPGIVHSIVHTGQHYDEAMSGAFFRDLGIPKPAHNLGVGSGTHGEQTSEMIRRLEPVLESERPDWVILYGDTNSTVAGALTAAKLHIKLAHIEAGLRSFNRQMPEEINRIVADHLSDLLFCPTTAGMENLRREGLESRAVLCGDVMYDAVLGNILAAESRADAMAYQWPAGEYTLATIHRAENTDDPHRLRTLVEALERIAAEVCPVVLAVHPRTRKALERNRVRTDRITIVPPLSYPDMLLFEKRARMILTDSGGVQKEAYFVRVPCVTLRDETEWTETLENGCNVIAGASDPDRIVQAALLTRSAGPWGEHYGRGHAGRIILHQLIETTRQNSLSRA
jgi:UDP-GlcNAc3NAcA epimerase